MNNLDLIRQYVEEDRGYKISPTTIPPEETKEEEDKNLQAIASFANEPTPPVVAGKNEVLNKPKQDAPLTVLDLFKKYAPKEVRDPVTGEIIQENNPEAYADSVSSYMNKNYNANVNKDTNIFDINKDYLINAIADVEGYYKSKEWNIAKNGREGNLPQDWFNPGMLEYHGQDGATPSPEVLKQDGSLRYEKGRFAVFENENAGFTALDKQVQKYQQRARERHLIDQEARLALDNAFDTDINKISQKIDASSFQPVSQEPVSTRTDIQEEYEKPAKSPGFWGELGREMHKMAMVESRTLAGSALQMASATAPREEGVVYRKGVPYKREAISREEATRRTQQSSAFQLGEKIVESGREYYKNTPSLHDPKNMKEFGWGTFLDLGVIGRAVGQGISTMALSIGTATATTIGTGGNVFAGIAAGMATTGILEAGFSYDEAKKYGLEPDEARSVGVLVGLANSILEFAPINKAFKSLGIKKEVQKKIIRNFIAKDVLKKTSREGFEVAVTEGVTEALQEGVNIAGELTYLRDEDKPTAGQIGGRMAQGFHGGFFSGGGIGTLTSAGGTVSSKIARDEVIKSISDGTLDKVNEETLSKALLTMTKEERMELGLSPEELQKNKISNETILRAIESLKKERRRERGLPEDAPSDMTEQDDGSFRSNDDILDSQGEILIEETSTILEETDEKAINELDAEDIVNIKSFNGISIPIDNTSDSIYGDLVGNEYKIAGKIYVLNKNTDEGSYEFKLKEGAKEVVDDSVVTPEVAVEEAAAEEVVEEAVEEGPLDTSKMLMKDLKAELKKRDLPLHGKKAKLKKRLDDAIAQEQAPAQEEVVEEAPVVEETPIVEEVVEEAPVAEEVVEEAPVVEEVVEEAPQELTEEISEEESASLNLVDIRNWKDDSTIAAFRKPPKSTKQFRTLARKLQNYIDSKMNSDNDQILENVNVAEQAIMEMENILEKRNQKFDDNFNVIDVKTEAQTKQDKKDLEAKKKAAIKGIDKTLKGKKKTTIKKVETKTPKTETKEYSKEALDLESRIDKEGAQSLIADPETGRSQLKFVDAKAIKEVAEKRGIDISKIKTSKKKMLEAIRDDIVSKREKPKVSKKQKEQIEIETRDVSVSDNARLKDRVKGQVQNKIRTQEQLADPNITPAKRRQLEKSLGSIEANLDAERIQLSRIGKRLSKEQGKKYKGLKSLKEVNQFIKDVEKETKEGIVKEQEAARTKEANEKLKQFNKDFTSYSKLENSGLMDGKTRNRMSRDMAAAEQELIELGVSESDINNLKSEITTKVEEDAKKDDFDDSDGPFGGEPTDADLKLTEDMVENGNRFGDDTGSYSVSQKLEDAAIVGAELMSRGFNQLKTFVPEMVRRYGNTIRPYAKKIFKKAKKYIQDYLKKFETGELAFGLSTRDISKQPLTKEEKAKLKREKDWRQRTRSKENKAYAGLNAIWESVVIDMLVKTSSTLGRIHPEIKRVFRQYSDTMKQGTTNDMERARPFLTKYDKLYRKALGFEIKGFGKRTKIKNKKIYNDLTDLDIALANGDMQTALEIGKKYNMDKEILGLRELLRDIFDRTIEAGYDKMNYTINYFPRLVSNHKAFEAHLYGLDPNIKSWYADVKRIKEKKLRRKLTEEEMADTLNNVISSTNKFKQVPSHTRNRSIIEVTRDNIEFYEFSHMALINYIQRANTAIARQEFFGKGVDVFGEGKDMSDSIGSKIQQLIKAGEIAPEMEARAINVLQAYFNRQPGIPGMKAFNTLTYGALLTSFLAVMGTFTEFAVNTRALNYNPIRFALEYGKAMPNIFNIYEKLGFFQNRMTMKKLGVEQITAEISSFSSDAGLLTKFIGAMFKITPFGWLDRVQKEVLVNGAWKKLQNQAKKWGDPNLAELEGTYLERKLYGYRKGGGITGTAKQRYKYKMKLTEIFGVDKNGNLNSNIIEDLKSGELTPDVKRLLWNILLDKQPISDTEVPPQYNKSSLSRMFYVLKNWTVTQMSDTYDMTRDDWLASRNAAEKMESASQFALYISFLAACGASGGVLRALWRGQEPDIEDEVVENFLRLSSLSRYSVQKFLESGDFRELTTGIVAPAGVSVVSTVAGDVVLLTKWLSGNISDNEKTLQYGVQSTRMVPVIGDAYYYGWRGFDSFLNGLGVDTGWVPEKMKEGGRGYKNYLLREKAKLEEKMIGKTNVDRIKGNYEGLSEKEKFVYKYQILEPLGEIKAWEQGKRVKVWNSLMEIHNKDAVIKRTGGRAR